MELLKRGAEHEVAELVAADRRAVRPLLSRLWDPDANIRRRAARALAEAASLHPDLGVEIVRRMLWALNDESGTNGLATLAAFGAIGRRSPTLLAPFLPMLVAMAEDSGLRGELLAALTDIAEVQPELVEPHLVGLERRLLGAPEPEQAAFAELRAVVRRSHAG